MHSLIDNLIFPAPKASYTPENIGGRLLYVPKFTVYAPNYPFLKQAKQPGGAGAGISKQAH